MARTMADLVAVLEVVAGYDPGDPSTEPARGKLIGDLNSPDGTNSETFAPTLFPAIAVPMGFLYGELPDGFQFLGRPFTEPALIKFAYAFEQATKHRRPPKSTPPLN